MYVHDHKVSVIDIRHSKFTVSRVECSLVHHGIFGRSECLVEKGSNPMGAFSNIEFYKFQVSRS